MPSITSSRLLVAVFLLLCTFPSTVSSYKCTEVGIVPDIDPGEPLVIDLYYCADDGDGDDDDDATSTLTKPLIVLIGGGEPDKLEYSMFANEMVKRGYNVAVLYKPLPFFDGSIANLASVSDVDVVIDYSRTNFTPVLLDTDNILLLGHSRGSITALYATAEICSRSFCGDDDPTSSFPLDANIKVVGLMGTTIFGRDGQPIYELTNLFRTRQQGIPLF
jgi:hypothetical protein